MTLPEIAGLALLAPPAFMTALWLASLALRNASIVDIFWGLGFVLLAWLYFALADGYSGPKILAELVSAWGLRLSGYILSRNWRKGEDYRYRQWREKTGGSFWSVSPFQMFLLQGALLWMISMPVLAAERYGSPGHLTAAAGIAQWGTGFLPEAVGDWQLARFKADPANKGKAMRSGLWRYPRRPNLFGDAAAW